MLHKQALTRREANRLIVLGGLGVLCPRVDGWFAFVSEQQGSEQSPELETVLDRRDDADRHFAAAIDQSRRLGSPVWIARCCLDWAESFADRDEKVRARELVDEADAAIGSLSLPRLQDQSASLTARLAQ